jgi:uncharacterized protein HemY
MEQKKEKGLRIRSCLTGAIWLALVFSTVISALLFAFLNHFFNLPQHTCAWLAFDFQYIDCRADHFLY